MVFSSGVGIQFNSILSKLSLINKIYFYNEDRNVKERKLNAIYTYTCLESRAVKLKMSPPWKTGTHFSCATSLLTVDFCRSHLQETSHRRDAAPAAGPQRTGLPMAASVCQFPGGDSPWSSLGPRAPWVYVGMGREFPAWPGPSDAGSVLGRSRSPHRGAVLAGGRHREGAGKSRLRPAPCLYFCLSSSQGATCL